MMIETQSPNDDPFKRLGHIVTTAHKFLNVIFEFVVAGREQDNRITIIQEAE
jgi:hypothetical protein